MGFCGDKPMPVDVKASRQKIWQHVHDHAERSVSFIDLCGHERYLKTTIFGLTALLPDYGMVIVGANMGVSRMTKEHIGIAAALGLPVLIIVTKVDIAPPDVYKHTMDTVTKTLRQARKMPFTVSKEEHVATAARSILSDRITPIIALSAVTGENMDLLRSLLRQLPQRVSPLATAGDPHKSAAPVGGTLDFAAPAPPAPATAAGGAAAAAAGTHTGDAAAAGAAATAVTAGAPAAADGAGGAAATSTTNATATGTGTSATPTPAVDSTALRIAGAAGGGDASGAAVGAAGGGAMATAASGGAGTSGGSTVAPTAAMLAALERPGEVTIDSVFNVPGVGTVVAGTVMKGAIRVGSTMLLGPDRVGEFQPVTIRSIHVLYTPCEVAYPGGSAAFAIRPKGKLRGGAVAKRSWVRKGMSLVDPALSPVSHWEFKAEALILHHQTTLAIGYTPILHMGVVTQAAKFTEITGMDNKPLAALRTGDRAIITARFMYRPEYIKEGQVVMFREGRAKGVGRVLSLACPNHAATPTAAPTATTTTTTTTTTAAATAAAPDVVATAAFSEG